MKTLARILFPMMLLATESILASDNITALRDYIKATYGEELMISDAQVSQLSWVMDNPHATPEMDHHKLAGMHKEVPRALSRIYNLQRLRSGTPQDYEQFIAPQKKEMVTPLSPDSFRQLSDAIRSMDEYHYEVLAAAAIISSVTLSPEAIKRARLVPDLKLPTDSVQFLAVTAPEASKIYPLAQLLSKRFKTGNHLFEIAFMPNSHLRHMMYNEGSLTMYEHIERGLSNGSVSRNDLTFWYYHWVINIAGFRGQIAPKGSLYLTQNTYNAMSAVKAVLDKLGKDKGNKSFNPMRAYLGKRADWLKLDHYTHNTDEQIALASIAASLRLFSPDQGKQLYQAFHKLSSKDQKRWLDYSHYQLSNTTTPAPTYAPALFANAVVEAGLADTIISVLPLFLDVIDKEQQMRKNGQLNPEVPVSFRLLSQHQQVHRLLHQLHRGLVIIDPVTGVASITK
ncbi:hypothetical protein GZ77_15345 [Endozoicomonas montiporae]|uniref:Uncharacterized protein n=2 Tax=Endozoicomonas montiporae TaxID=1027273 RepID=A0A081N5F5_9GAMM|nr:hypothetical protein [Endozoicomonas montiporae]AMO57438.1 hypothetical protein EZMO1_3448 [Endozoicomonas montiporae CL-33]KEQ13678.1 hypothetical protein GZ77_15345 [Endozoicomonas montiporae]